VLKIPGTNPNPRKKPAMPTARLLFLLTLLACGTYSCTAQEIAPPTDVEATGEALPGALPTETAPEASRGPVCFTPREILPFAFTPDGERLMVRTGQGVQVANLLTGEEDVFYPSDQSIYTAALSPDGTTLAWSVGDGTIQLFQLADPETLVSLTAHPDTVYDLRFSPRGDRLLSVSHDGWVRYWDTTQASLLPSIQAGREIVGIGVSPDGGQVATIPFDGPVQIWDLATTQVVSELGGTGGYDTSDAVFSPDGRYLAADLATGIYLWDVARAELVWDRVKNSMAVAYSPDGQYLAYSDFVDGNKIFLAAPDGSTVVRELEGMQAPVWELFFSPDSTMIAATDGVEIRIWRVGDGELLSIGKFNCP
jgi:WD40 repeat protein